MERGIFWLILLITFAVLAWLGAREYQKIQVYQKWAEEFDQAKYDIYSVIGYRHNQITWGKPSPKEILDLQDFSLEDVKTISLLIDNQIIKDEKLPQKGKPFIQFEFKNSSPIIKIPFTEISLAFKWKEYLNLKI
jgi:hypothetical protein